MAYTGLNTPMQVISPSSIAMTSTSPAAPEPMKASPAGQHARSVPAVSMTLCRPYRATSRLASREPIMPPTQGTAKARPYCQGAKCRRPSMRTASSGAVARIRALTPIVLKNSGRSAGFVRMYRQPSARSRARSREAPVRAGCGSLPPMARIPAAQIPIAESR